METSSVLVIGASGKTGRLVVKELITRGYSNVTILTRHLEYKESFEKLGTHVIIGDAKNADLMQQIVSDKDIVINCLRSDSLILPIDNTVNTNILKNLSKGKIYVFISAIGVGDSAKNLPLRTRIFFNTIMRNVVSQKEKAERAIQKSELQYIIVRPGGLLDNEGVASDKITVVKQSPSGIFGTILRSKLAIIIVDLIENPNSYKKIWECAELS